MSALLLLYKQGGMTQEVPFVCKDGQLVEAIEQLAEYLYAAGQGDSLWETVAGERLNVILTQRQKMNEMANTIAQLKEWAEMFAPEALREAVG